MTTSLAVTLVEDAVTARAELLTAHAPRTVQGVLGALPREGECLHAIYSGSEVFMLLDPGIWLPPENATTAVAPGDLAYGRVVGGQHRGFPDDLSELLWFYDEDAVPSMPEGPMPVNVFARFTEGWEAFAAASLAMRREGSKHVRFERG